MADREKSLIVGWDCGFCLKEGNIRTFKLSEKKFMELIKSFARIQRTS